MAIVEDEVRNESEEENEIEVVVEEDDAEQDSDDSEDDDDEEALEKKVAELESQIKNNSNDYSMYMYHIELLQALWSLSELERWRAAFERLQEKCLIQPDHWLMRIQTEESLAHSAESKATIAELYQQAALDCYSIPIFSQWCTWSMSLGSVELAREQLDTVLKLAGADPLSGKLFWDAKLELEETHLNTLSKDSPEYKTQKELVLWCLEEIASRPLLRGAEALPRLELLAADCRDQAYIDKIKAQHEAAVEFLNKITPFEDKLLLENKYDKDNHKIYEEYIETVKQLATEERFADCDCDGILKILYDRATSCGGWGAWKLPLLQAWHGLARRRSSRESVGRVLAACLRRSPHTAAFWVLSMHQLERAHVSFDEVKAVFEKALSNVRGNYREVEAIWMTYLEYLRRQTALDCEADVERLRRTFRLGWNHLIEAWGDEANDCEVPLFWARFEYNLAKDYKQGKELFEEMFKYGDNKSTSRYWVALIGLESRREPPLSEHKMRDLYRRALKFITDYPPSVAQMWLDYERDYGKFDTFKECFEMFEVKTKQWRENYLAMKDRYTSQKPKGKQTQTKKTKSDFKKKGKEDDKPKKGKRKADDSGAAGEAKKKRDASMETDESKEDSLSTGGVKRPHGEEDGGTVSKRQRTESESSGEHSGGGVEACTLFVSNLEFKVNEENLRAKLSEFGSIVTMRVKSGVKAFGGSICYCQYTSPQAVATAIKHDREPLDGRPMFLSKYTVKKTVNPATFKYATTEEKNKLFVKNLPFSHCTKKALTEIFEKHGALKDVRAVTFKDGKPKGLAYIEYEDEASASAALAKTNGLNVSGKKIEVLVSAPPPRPTDNNSLGLPKRDTGGGMRRTQLSSFIPSVLQKASTSKAAENGNSDKRPLSNSDFRSLLLKK